MKGRLQYRTMACREWQHRAGMKDEPSDAPERLTLFGASLESSAFIVSTPPGDPGRYVVKATLKWSSMMADKVIFCVYCGQIAGTPTKCPVRSGRDHEFRNKC